MTNQLLPMWTIETKFARLTNEECRRFLGFVALLKGGFEPFLWKDPEDFKEVGAPCSLISGSKYQAFMRFGDYLEPAEYIEDVTVYVDGKKYAPSGYTVTNGVITFNSAQSATAKITADYTYYWKVRFKDDSATITAKFINFNDSKSFKLVTVR